MALIMVLDNNVSSIISIRRKLLLSLQEKGYEVIICTTGNETNLKLAQQLGLTVVDIGTSIMNPLHILRYLINLRRAIKKYQPQVCLTFTIRPAIWGNLITRLQAVPTLTNITGVGPLFEHHNLAYKGARLIYKFVLKKTAKIFFQNEDDRQLFIDHSFTSSSKAIKIPGSGIDYEYFSPQLKKTDATSFRFLFISRLVKDKGIMEFLTCASRMKRELGNSIHFSIIGPFWNQNLKGNTVRPEELQTWIDKNEIEYLGEQNDIRPFVADADCIVLPSYREGTSNVLLESSSMEKPCITCNVTGCKEVVEDNYNGFLCEVKSVDSLYTAMKKMYHLSSAEREVMGKNGRVKMIKEFDKKIVVNAYVQEIEKILGANKK
jgi:glycosyltransferase involved in cell wall biosynthesis